MRDLRALCEHPSFWSASANQNHLVPRGGWGVGRRVGWGRSTQQKPLFSLSNKLVASIFAAQDSCHLHALVCWCHLHLFLLNLMLTHHQVTKSKEAHQKCTFTPFSFGLHIVDQISVLAQFIFKRSLLFSDHQRPPSVQQERTSKGEMAEGEISSRLTQVPVSCSRCQSAHITCTHFTSLSFLSGRGDPIQSNISLSLDLMYVYCQPG